MENQRLRVIVDYILTRASREELTVIRRALESREKGPNHEESRKTMADKARETADQIQKQLEIPKEAIQKMVRDMAARIIRQNAPEIPEDQVTVLLNEWVKDPVKKEKAKSLLPKEVLLTMATQFVAFSTGTLAKADEANLRKSMADWPEKYWDAFPETIRKIISQYLKAQMDGAQFWALLYSALGIEKVPPS